MSYGITNQIEVLSNGIETTDYTNSQQYRDTFRKRYGYDPTDKIILSVGSYFKRKGIVDFVEFAKKMSEYKFIWFGYNADYQIPTDVWEAVYTQLPNLIFAGYCPKQELIEAYSGCDLFIFPSYEETEGIVTLEALSTEIPVLVRDIGVYEDWLEHGVNAYKANSQQDFLYYSKAILEKEIHSLVKEGRKVATDRDANLQGLLLLNLFEQCAYNANVASS